MWLLSHEVGFEVTVRSVCAGTTHGVDSIRVAIGQLEKCGYLKRYQRRLRGRIVGIDWELRDPFTPVDNPGLFERELKALNPMKSEKPLVRPQADLPDVVEPALVKPGLVNPTTKEEQLKEELTKELNKPTIDAPVDNFEPGGTPTSRDVAAPPLAACGHLGYWPDAHLEDEAPHCVLSCVAFKNLSAELATVGLTGVAS